MRILWVKVGGLWPPHTGGRLRSLHILGDLARRNRVTLLTTHGPGDDPAGLAGALPDLEEVASLPFAIPKHPGPRFAAALLRSWLSGLPVDLDKVRHRALSREVRRRLATGGFDLCVADFLSAAVNVPPGHPTPVVLFSHNVEHLIWKRLAAVERRPLRRLLLAIEWRKMRRAEARACARARLTLAVSEADRDALAALAPAAAIRAIPTGVDPEYFAPRNDREEPDRLVFIGSMDWHPNEDAILHFLETILPRLRRAAPGVRLDIVGRHPSRRLRAAAGVPGVRVTGTVEDVRPYLAAAAVAVVPLRVGGGTRLKIFEALAMGKAVVSTGIGAEGLPLVPGTHIVLADDPERFASEVAALLGDPARRRALGLAGRRLVESRYSWAAVAREFEDACAGAAAARRQRAPAPYRRGASSAARLAPRARRLYWRLRLRRLLENGSPPPDIPAGALLFVCHGNLIRSPMAAALARRRLSEQGVSRVRVQSAGLHAGPGRPADGRAEMAAAAFGVSLRGHRARRLTGDLARRADLIFVMDTRNQAELLVRHPEAAGKVFLVGADAPARRGRPLEIADPFTGTVEDVKRCYRLLDACVSRRAERIARSIRSRPEEARHAG